MCVASAHGVGGTSSRMAWEARPRLCPRARVHVCVCLCVFGAVGVQKKNSKCGDGHLVRRDWSRA